MNNLGKLRMSSLLKSVSLDFSGCNLGLSRTTYWATGSYGIVQSLRFYRKKKSVEYESGKENAAQREAQAVLLEYLHLTRSLHYSDAEHVSSNSPRFLEKLLKKVKNETEIGRSLSRFLRYHPINEFEPFFESMGLKPSEYSPFLPRNLMYLADAEMLMENYHVLCSYEMPRNNIGKIYKEVPEVFKYDYGVLQSKLQALEALGLNQSAVRMFVLSCPKLLIANKSKEFVKVLEKFKIVGIKHNWIQGHLLEGISYNWIHMFELLSLLSSMDYSEQQLGKLICQHPDLLFEASGNIALLLIGCLLKFGFSKDEIHSLFLEFPQIQLKKFANNFRQCYHFLVETEMEPQEIGRIVRSHPILLGSCSLKKVNSLLTILNTGKKRLCDIIKENPQILKDWVVGSRVKRLPDSGEELRSQMLKTKFLVKLGFVENSNEMKRALKVFRGKGGELQERFDCFLKAGLSRKDVSEMIKGSPQVLNLSKDVIKMRIDFLLNELGYPLSALLSFPSYVCYTIERVKFRFSMYDWLKDQGIMKPKLALSTILSTSDNIFMKQYVNQHPEGPEVWMKLKKQFQLVKDC